MGVAAGVGPAREPFDVCELAVPFDQPDQLDPVVELLLEVVLLRSPAEALVPDPLR